jgi:hypothetical protein
MARDKLIPTRLIERGWSAPRVAIRPNKPRLLWILIQHALF